MRRIVMASVAAVMVVACSAASLPEEDVTEVRLNYFANVTHAPAIIGLEKGFFVEELGEGITIKTSTTNSGTSAIEALFGDAIDMTFIGPNPAINGYSQSNGEALRIVAGSTSGGAAFVVSPEITSPEGLVGATLATPSLGNTQDVALRAWLTEMGFEVDVENSGNVSIINQDNAETLRLFQAGEIDGAWEPEPWATRLVLEGGGHVLVDERDLWPDGQFVTVHLIVATTFLDQHPEIVEGVLRGLIRAVDYANEETADAQATVNAGIEAITGSTLPPEVIEGAWQNLTFTVDPVASSLRESAADAEAVGLLEPIDLAGIYDLTLLNAILVEEGRPEVSS